MSHAAHTIDEYVRTMRHIKAQAAAARTPISGAQFDDYVLRRFFREQHERAAADATKSSETAATSDHMEPRRRTSLRTTTAITVAIIAAVIAVSTHAPLRAHIGGLFMMHIQTLIHPAMSWWRLVTLPLLGAVPALSALYDESCLLPNPLFHIHGMDCAPCSGVHSVLDFGVRRAKVPTDDWPEADAHRPHVFHVPADDSGEVTVERLHALYTEHSHVYRLDAYAVRSPTARVRNLDEMFAAFGVAGANSSGPASPSMQLDGTLHALWRLNRMNAVRLLRTVIGRTAAGWLPRTGMHIERYVAIDAANAPAYRLPDMECARVFVAQLAGARTMVLRPSGECADSCRTVSVRLAAGSVLMYDWWYWRPVSVPDPLQDGNSISYIGAYC